jgi:iron complex outermembrane receptor protein
MNACLKTAGWLGAALPMFAAMIDVTPAEAQSSARELPAVVVDQPLRPPAARSRPAPRRQAASAASRRAAQRGQTTPDAAAAAGARAETATGPVQGYIANQSATATKTDTPLNQTPQSITVVTADRMRDQGVTTVQEAFRYVPGVNADAYGPDSRVDSIMIRGMNPDIYLDGMRITNSWWNYQRVEPYALERAEALRGPSSTLYGSTTTAGLINLVSKRPRAEALHEVEVQYGSFNRKQIQTDHTGKISEDGRWLYRVIGVFRDSDYQTDYVKDNRVFFMPAVTWLPTDMTTWTVLANYQKDKTGSSTAFLPHSGTISFNPNGTIPINRFVGDPNYDLYQTETKSITSLFEHRFNDSLRISVNARYQDVNGIYNTVYSNSFFNPITFGTDPYLDPARRTISRYVDAWNSHRQTFTSDSNAEVKFNTGPLSHRVLAGFDYRRMDETGTAGSYLDLTPFDLYSPVYTSVVPPVLSVLPELSQRQAGVYVQDQVKWGPLIGLFGLRHDQATSNLQGNPSQTDKATTWRAALMYELPYNVTPYFSYAKSFDPQFGTAPYGNNRCVDSATGLCKPVLGEQYEVGFKYKPSNTLAINGALFDITQQNRIAYSANSLGAVQIGRASIKGAELEVLTTLWGNLDIIGAYTYLDAKVVEGDNAGKRIETVPEHQTSLWAKYRFMAFGIPGFSVGAGVRYIGEQWDGTDTLMTPSKTLFDAMIAWENRNWRFQINGSNLGDQQYFSSCLARGDCFYGARRSILSRLTYKF